MRKKSIALLLCFTISMSLTSCASDEAKAVINDIKSLDKITLDSYSELVRVNAEYDELSEEDKESVRNYDDLQKANEEFNLLKYEDLNERIKKTCDNISADSINDLESLNTEYLELSKEGQSQVSNYKLLEDSMGIAKALKFNDEIADICSEITADDYDTILTKQNEYVYFTLEQQERITNYDLLMSSFEKSKSLKGEAVKEYIKNNANGSFSLAKDEYNKYKDIMTDKQLKTAMLEIARWEAVDEAEKYLSNFLKSPQSYIRYSATTTFPVSQKNNVYKTKVELKYGASNSFGAEITDKAELYVYITLNLETKNYSFKSTEFTEYYAWKLASSK